MSEHRPPKIGYHAAGTPDLPEEHSATQHVSLGTYIVVFIALMVLLVVTVWAAFYIRFGGILVALFIAIIKAGLVVLYFMHVKYASRLTKIFVSAAFLWLAIFFALTFSDYLTRAWSPVSRGWVEKKTQAPVQIPDPVRPPAPAVH
jgi:cytochrome c oxidase subunit 4